LGDVEIDEGMFFWGDVKRLGGEVHDEMKALTSRGGILGDAVSRDSLSPSLNRVHAEPPGAALYLLSSAATRRATAG